jgi:hypothetical protein
MLTSIAARLVTRSIAAKLPRTLPRFNVGATSMKGNPFHIYSYKL